MAWMRAAIVLDSYNCKFLETHASERAGVHSGMHEFMSSYFLFSLAKRKASHFHFLVLMARHILWNLRFQPPGHNKFLNLEFQFTGRYAQFQILPVGKNGP